MFCQVPGWSYCILHTSSTENLLAAPNKTNHCEPCPCLPNGIHLSHDHSSKKSIKPDHRILFVLCCGARHKKCPPPLRPASKTKETPGSSPIRPQCRLQPGGQRRSGGGGDRCFLWPRRRHHRHRLQHEGLQGCQAGRQGLQRGVGARQEPHCHQRGRAAGPGVEARRGGRRQEVVRHGCRQGWLRGEWKGDRPHPQLCVPSPDQSQPFFECHPKNLLKSNSFWPLQFYPQKKKMPGSFSFKKCVVLGLLVCLKEPWPVPPH